MEKERQNNAYMYYIAEGVKVLTENTQRFAGGGAITRSLYDIIRPKVDSRSAEEVVNEVIKKSGLKLGG